MGRSTDKNRARTKVNQPLFVKIHFQGEDWLVDARELFSDTVVELFAVAFATAKRITPDVDIAYDILAGRWGLVRANRWHRLWCRTEKFCHCESVQAYRPLHEHLAVYGAGREDDRLSRLVQNDWNP